MFTYNNETRTLMEWAELYGLKYSLLYDRIFKEGLSFEEAYNNDRYDWTDFGFEYVESLLETDKAEAVYCLKKSNAIRESYEKHTLVGNHDIASLSTKAPVAQIEDASDIPETYDDEEIPF